MTAEPRRPLASCAGNEVRLRGWSLGRLDAPGADTCELIEARFLGFGSLEENEAGGELAIIVICRGYFAAFVTGVQGITASIDVTVDKI